MANLDRLFFCIILINTTFFINLILKPNNKIQRRVDSLEVEEGLIICF